MAATQALIARLTPSSASALSWQRKSSRRESCPCAPSQREVFGLGLVSWLVFLAVIKCFGPYTARVDGFGDSSAYLNAAESIRHWQFAGLVVKQFWGLPYLVALISEVTHLSGRTSLLAACWIGFFVSLWLAHRLWGGWVAAFFALLNFDWLQRSFLGGSEPLFVALLFGSFLAVRTNRHLLAVLLAALATTVRPLGFIALVGIGIVILQKRLYREAAAAIAVSASIGLAYVLPIAYAVGDPLATVHSYTNTASGPALFGIPFYAIVTGTLAGSAPWTNLLLSFSWILAVVAGISLLILNRKHYIAEGYSAAELWFAAGYFLMICAYNLPTFARGSFARFAIPVIPFALIGWMPWIPKSRILIRVLAVATPIFAAASSVGIVNVLHQLR